MAIKQKNLKIKSIKADFSNVQLPTRGTVHDYQRGKMVEDILMEQGYHIDTSGTVDIPEWGVEVKTRQSHSHSAHTTGTMTHNNIIHTSWEESDYRDKLQRQYRITIDSETGTVAEDIVVDLTHNDLQSKMKSGYEIARKKIIDHYNQTGEMLTGTVAGNMYGSLEHRPGKSGTGRSYAHRISDGGMKRLIKTARSTFTDLFE